MTMTVPAQDPAISKLYSVLGEEKAGALVAQLLRELGLSSIATADDRLRLGNALITRGGVLEAIGRAIKIQAILHGAAEPRTSGRPR
jgi:hypothetical protein